MEQFSFCGSGMWMFPMIGMCIFCMIIMVFFCFRCFGGSRFGFPFHRFGDSDRPTKDGHRSETALEILNRRYANGEISKEEYERIKKDILS
jgi:putative membrane protein